MANEVKSGFVDDRVGFLTPDEEVIAEKNIKLKGIWEAVDGLAIKVVDNQGFQKLKEKFLSDHPQTLELIYELVDMLFTMLPNLTEETIAKIKELKEKGEIA